LIRCRARCRLGAVDLAPGFLCHPAFQHSDLAGPEAGVVTVRSLPRPPTVAELTDVSIDTSSALPGGRL